MIQLDSTAIHYAMIPLASSKHYSMIQLAGSTIHYAMIQRASSTIMQWYS